MLASPTHLVDPKASLTIYPARFLDSRYYQVTCCAIDPYPDGGDLYIRASRKALQEVTHSSCILYPTAMANNTLEYPPAGDSPSGSMPATSSSLGTRSVLKSMPSYVYLPQFSSNITSQPTSIN